MKKIVIMGIIIAIALLVQQSSSAALAIRAPKVSPTPTPVITVVPTDSVPTPIVGCGDSPECNPQ